MKTLNKLLPSFNSSPEESGQGLNTCAPFKKVPLVDSLSWIAKPLSTRVILQWTPEISLKLVMQRSFFVDLPIDKELSKVALNFSLLEDLKSSSDTK